MWALREYYRGIIVAAREAARVPETTMMVYKKKRQQRAHELNLARQGLSKSWTMLEILTGRLAKLEKERG